MATCRGAIALSVLTFAGSLTITGQGQALDVRCQRGELLRQVRVQFARDGDGLPCQVIWQNTAGSGQRELVWSSDSQLDFCTDKARELVHQLTDGGWTCEAEVTASADRSAPAATVRLEPAARQPDAALRLRPETVAPEQVAPSAGGAKEESRRPDRTVLQTALARDVERLDQMAGPSRGGFDVTMARLGDLDGDGIEDAVALLTHRAEGTPPSHHLLAYLFDGETFRPVARVALTETPAESTEAQIQDIVDGVVEVVVHVPQPGDPACCPSGRRRASFVLRDQQLVDLGKDRPGS